MQNTKQKPPASPLPGPITLSIVTTATGYFKPGLTGRIIGAADRVVYLGEPPQPYKVPEFTIQLDTGTRREFCQYGRDFVFTEPAARSFDPIEIREIALALLGQLCALSSQVKAAGLLVPPNVTKEIERARGALL